MKHLREGIFPGGMMKSVIERLRTLSSVSIGTLAMLSTLAIILWAGQRNSMDRLVQQHFRSFADLKEMEILVSSNQADSLRLANWATAGYDQSRLINLSNEIVQRQEKGDALLKQLAARTQNHSEMDTIERTFAEYGRQSRETVEIILKDASRARIFLRSTEITSQKLLSSFAGLSASESSALRDEADGVRVTATRGLLFFLFMAGGVALGIGLFSTRPAFGIGVTLGFLSDRLEHSFRELLLPLRVSRAGRARPIPSSRHL